MAQQTDAELLAAAEIIKDETQSKANTHTRVGVMLENLIESKLNNESVGPLIAATTGKTTPVDGDSTILSDSEASGAQKKLTWANLKATLKTYFDSLYQAALGYTAENSANKTDTITGNESSSTLYASIKGIYDWISGLTIISKDVTSNAMLTTSANTIKIDTTASGSFDNLIATDLPNNIQAALQALGGPVIVEQFTGIIAGSFPLSFTPSPLFTPLIFSFDSLGVVRYENFQSNISGSTLNFVNPSGGVGPYNVNVHYKKTI